MPALQWFDVSELAKAHEAFLLATKERATSTASDPFSSRSQCLFLFGVEQKIRNPPPGCPATRRSMVYLVGLAGRERIGKSGVEGQKLVEATKMNRSLTTLRSVVGALYRGEKQIAIGIPSSHSFCGSPSPRVDVASSSSPTSLVSRRPSMRRRRSVRFADSVKELSIQGRLRALLEKMEMSRDGRRIALRVDELVGEGQRLEDRIAERERVDAARAAERKAALGELKTWKRAVREEHKASTSRPRGIADARCCALSR
jgi:hypothetical protein